MNLPDARTSEHTVDTCELGDPDWFLVGVPVVVLDRNALVRTFKLRSSGRE